MNQQLAGRHRGEARQDGRRDPGSMTMAEQKKIKVTLVKGVSRTVKGHRETVRGLGLKWTNHTVEVIDTPSTRGMIKRSATCCASSRVRNRRHATQHDQARGGQQEGEAPRRPRHRLRARQDRRSRPQGPEVALGRLPQGRLRRRPDAAAAPAAEARLRLAVEGRHGGSPPVAILRSCRWTKSTCSRSRRRASCRRRRRRRR